jgi:catechol 2,3-dioxygenase-like lactoylglutathione lyase family enzyme
MDASVVSHIAICTRNMEKSLAFYRDILEMKVLADGMTDPTEGGRLHNYQQKRQSRRRVSLSFGAGKKPTLTNTSHPDEDIAGVPLKLDHGPDGRVAGQGRAFGRAARSVHEPPGSGAQLLRARSRWHPDPV